ncbi:MAG TPA: hypothetical protein EYP25_01770 [Anaerolineae bacterium]|nr:ABC transporter permease subunit [Caldilineae bacterium]HID33298.1 hypothetical protein [Anaerolineae bacterium]HIQ12171.1 hypothetical protein [Caldilineales bacterium]
MNIYLHELRANLKSLLIWIGIVALLVWTGIIKFQVFTQDPSALALLDAYPQALLDALNMRAFNLSTLTGFFGSMFSYIGLMAAVAAGLWGSGVIVREERRKTVEFALSLPVTRTRWVTAKFLAALTHAALFVLATWALSLLAARSHHPDAAFNAFLARLMAAMFAIELIFLAVGLLIACVMKQPKRTGSVVIGVILTAYYLSLIAGLDDRVDFLKYVTPFKYFDPAQLLHTGGVEPVYWALTAGVLLVSLAGAYVAFNRRDIYV